MARTFDGVDDQVAFGSEAAIDDLAAFTACALVRITGNVTDERQILNKMNSSFNGAMYISATGGGGNNNKIFSLIGGSSSAYSETTADILAVNTWKVIVTTWGGGAGSDLIHIYSCTLGGTIAEASYTGSPVWVTGRDSDAAATLRIGTRDPLDATFFAGGIAECALWNRVLSADELAALGRGFAPAFFPNGRVFYSKVDGRSSPELNYAGTTHGTLTGTTYLEHPPMIYPARMGTMKTGGVAGSSFKAAWARGSNAVIGAGAR